MLPSLTVPNLRTHILSLVRKRLPGDRTARCNTMSVPCETLVEVPRGGVCRPRRNNQRPLRAT